MLSSHSIRLWLYTYTVMLLRETYTIDLTVVWQSDLTFVWQVVVPPSPLPGKYVTVYDSILTCRLNPFSISLKYFEIYVRIFAPKKLAPKNFPRYIQCGISRTGERLFQKSTEAWIGHRRLGYMYVSWRGCNHSWVIRWRGRWCAINEYGTDILDKIPAWRSIGKNVDAYDRKIKSI